MTACHYCQRKLGFNEEYYVIKCGKKRVGVCCENCYDSGCKLRIDNHLLSKQLNQ